MSDAQRPHDKFSFLSLPRPTIARAVVTVLTGGSMLSTLSSVPAIAAGGRNPAQSSVTASTNPAVDSTSPIGDSPALSSDDVAIPFETDPPPGEAAQNGESNGATVEIPFESPNSAPATSPNPTLGTKAKTGRGKVRVTPKQATTTQVPSDTSSAPSDLSLAPESPSGPKGGNTSATQKTDANKNTKSPTLFINTLPKGAENKVFEDSNLTGKSRKNNGFTVPLLFAPEDNGFELGRPQVRWDLRNGKDALLTGLRVRSSSISFAITQTPRKSEGILSKIFTGHDDRPFVTNISFRWPQIFATTGKFSLEDPSGKIVYSQEMTASTHAEWNGYLESSAAKHMPDTPIHAGSQWGQTDIDSKDFSFLFKKNRLRACLSKTIEQEQSLKICTGTINFAALKDGHVTQTPGPEVKPTALLEGKEVGDRGLINFPEGKKIDFGLRFASGASVHINTQPLLLKIYDVIESPSGRTVLLTGQGAQPVGRVKILKTPDVHFWSGTIIKQERIWQLAISKDAPIVKVLGSFNMPFDLLFDAKRLPKEADRAYIAERQTQTYVREPFLYGTAGADLKIESNETRVRKLSATDFRWLFLAEKESANNKARLKLTEKDGTPWVAHYDIYRAPSSEVAGHFTGVLSSNGQAVAMGEIMAMQWFESLGFTDNRRLALQHWGIDVRYFRAFSSFKLADDVTVSNFDQLMANLRFNLNHGIWNRDEIFGIMLSGEHLTFSTLSATVLGPGVYWGRTMPKILDDAFNLIPLLRFPKYLEVEFSYLPISASSKVKAGPTYNLNFRGKCFFTSEFFGEAGFGVKQLDFIDNDQAQEAAFTTAYGLVGLGLLF